MTEGRALWIVRIAGGVVLVLFFLFQAVNPKAPVVANTPGFRDPVAGFELASKPEHVLGILGPPGAPERSETVRRMERGTRVDFLFLVAYPAFYVGMALLLVARGRASRAAGTTLVVLALVMALGDACENRELLRLAEMTDPAAMLAPLARLRAFTLAKWWAIYAASGAIGVLVWWERSWWRWSAPLFALAALCGLVSLVHLPAIEWGIAPLGLAWTITWIWAWARSPSAG